MTDSWSDNGAQGDGELILTRDLCRYYRRGPSEVRALDHVDVRIDAGEFVAVVGASGSGKTTLLNLLAGLDTPTAGEILIDDRSLAALSRRERAAYRAKRVGMIHQSFNLLPHRNALENVTLPLYFDGTPRRERNRRAQDVLHRLGLADRLDHAPSDLSGGEQQRVAAARAIVTRPRLLLADEPTGNLDEDNTTMIADLLREMNGEGITVAIVTHDLALAKRVARRVVRMEYGRVVSDDVHGDGGQAR